MKDSKRDIKPVLKKYVKTLKSKENVRGCGIGEKKIKGVSQNYLSLVVFVDKKLPLAQLKDEDIVPDHIEGIETDVVETGEVRVQMSPQEKHRPFFGGISCGHPTITAGTVGVPALKAGDKTILLSNAHVIAPHWSADISEGDSILQPGPADGGVEGDKVAELLDWKEIKFDDNEENEIDAAIAECTDEVDTYVIKIGNYLSLAEEPETGINVIKHGRTTGYTEGEITATDVEVDVNFGDDKVATFVDQMVIESITDGSFSDGGDSGSVIFIGTKDEPTSEMIGLLFAGNDSYTLANDINKVFSEFDLEVMQDVPELTRGEELQPEEEGSKIYKSVSSHKNWKDDYMLEVRVDDQIVYPQKKGV